jgi:hypothetical protein
MCLIWERGWSHVITRMVLDDSFKDLSAIHTPVRHSNTDLVFCEVTYARHTVLCFVP